MAISMVRQPSETPNITNIDDIIPFRYAYGNQNGYVINRGTEISYTVNGNQFTINSGRLVVQGVESDIDANGVTLTIDAVSETRYYTVYHSINLGTNTANIQVAFDTATYPNINSGDDLTYNSNGISNLELYHFIATNGIISGVEKIIKAVDYTGSALVGYDNSKGTVEERLKNLGFNEGDATFFEDERIALTLCHFVQEGNSTFLNVSFRLKTSLDAYNGSISPIIIGKLPENFKKFNRYTPIITIKNQNQATAVWITLTIYINEDNEILYRVDTGDPFGTGSHSFIDAKQYNELKISFLNSPNKIINYTYNYDFNVD